MIRPGFAPPAFIVLLLASAASCAWAAKPAPVDPLTACLSSDSYPAKADREKIIADCGKALEAGVADPVSQARVLVNRSTAQWRLSRPIEAEKDAEAALKLVPGDADALLARGVARMDPKRIDEALADFETVLKTQPRNATALLYRGRVRQWYKDDPAGAKADYDAALAIDPKSIRAYIQRADLLLYEDAVAAERDLKIAAGLAPDNMGVQLQIGIAYELQDRTKEALQVYDQIMRVDPQDAYTLTYRSALKRWLGDKAAALGDADQAVRIDPTLARAHYVRGQALVALGKAADAMAAYREAVKLDADYVEPLIGIGSLSRELNQLDEGLAAVDAALKMSPKNSEALFDRALILAAKQETAAAIKAYGDAIAAKPSAAAHYNRAQLHAAAGDHKAALADYQKAAELDPKDPDALNGAGIELGELGRTDEELKAYDAALAVDPANNAAKINKAIVYADLEDWPKAIVAYRVAISAQPKRADLRARLGDTLVGAGQDDAARREYDQALKLDATLVRAWSARALLHRRNGRLRDAVADYGRALALWPDDADLLVGRAVALRLDKQDRAAMADLDAAVKLAPKSAFVFNNRGLANAVARRHDAALADYASAIAADPDYEPAYYNRAGVFIYQDRYDRAIRDLNVSLRLSPGDSLTLARKGYVYSLVKDYRRALEELDAALAVDPTYIDALQWRADVKTELGDTAGAAADSQAAKRLSGG